MTLFQALLLGALQGLTEFLPISSSGHLVLAESFLGIQVPAQDLLGFDVLLHAGSLGAIIVFYLGAWWQMARKNHVLLLKIFGGTVPAGVAGFLLSDIIGTTFHTVLITSVLLGVTGGILFCIDAWRSSVEKKDIRWRDAMIIGCLQALALFPGISRSGITIAGGYFCGLHRRAAVDFSFLLAGPIIAGATLHTMQGWWNGGIVLPPLSVSMAGGIASFVMSMCAIGFMRYWVQRRTLKPFGIYLLLLSIGGVWVTLIH